MENNPNNQIKPKIKTGAKPKILPFLEEMKKFMYKNNGDLDLDVIVCTDYELFQIINSKLAPVDKVHSRTIDNWKSGQVKDELCDMFIREYKNALILQKKALITRMVNEEKSWQKYAWIIERKFEEWNLRKITEVKAEIQLSSNPIQDSLLLTLPNDKTIEGEVRE